MSHSSNTTFKKGRKPGPGRPKGLPNKSTQDAREAIGKFVDGNAHRLQDWLDQVATGIPARNADGEIIEREGRIVWQREPDPEKAYDLFQKVIEYHVPKLNRSEVNHSGTVKVSDALRDIDKEPDAGR